MMNRHSLLGVLLIGLVVNGFSPPTRFGWIVPSLERLPSTRLFAEKEKKKVKREIIRDKPEDILTEDQIFRARLDQTTEEEKAKNRVRWAKFMDHIGFHPNATDDDLIIGKELGPAWRRLLDSNVDTDPEFNLVAQVALQSLEAMRNEELAKAQEGPNKSSLLDASLDMDPVWKEARVPFMDDENRVVDCKLAFTIPLDGVTYGIGVPHDHPVFLVVRDQDGEVETIDPDQNLDEGLMEVMANAVKNYLSEDLSLKRTPRVLTIQGDLDAITNDWENGMFKSIGDNITMDTFFGDPAEDKSEEEITEGLFDFFKETLGEDEVDYLLKKDASEVSDEDMKFFEFDEDVIPKEEIEHEYMEIMDDVINRYYGGASAENPPGPAQAISKEELMKQLSDLGLDYMNGVGLKLVSFEYQDGRSYSIVKPTIQFTYVGRRTDEEENLQFRIMTREEEHTILPRLQVLAKKDLEESGLSDALDPDLQMPAP